MILPGGTIGILGGGQLGRMTIQAGRRMGYRFHVYEPLPDPCAAPTADVHIAAPYEDRAALEKFADDIDVATFEFENIPISAVEALECKLPVRPGSNAMRVCQDRLREKAFLKEHGYPHVDFEAVESDKDLRKAVERIGEPCILKPTTGRYDGSGIMIHEADQCEDAWKELSETKGIVEKWIPFRGEFSVICARNHRGNVSVFPIAENVYSDFILDFTIAPARISNTLKLQAEELAISISEKLNAVGVITVELYLTHNEEWIINELSPRPHNSGHFTIDACATTQFEQHVRAICDMPLGDTSIQRPCTMLNILGDSWTHTQPDWNFLLADSTAKLHLYDKSEAVPRRKMGHMTFLGESPDDALARALQAREWLGRSMFV